MSEIDQLLSQINSGQMPTQRLKELQEMANAQLLRYEQGLTAITRNGDSFTFEDYQEALRLASGGNQGSVTRSEWDQVSLFPEKRLTLRDQLIDSIKQGQQLFVTIKAAIDAKLSPKGSSSAAESPSTTPTGVKKEDKPSQKMQLTCPKCGNMFDDARILFLPFTQEQIKRVVETYGEDFQICPKCQNIFNPRLETYSLNAATYDPQSFRTLWLWFAWLVGAGTPLCVIVIGLVPLIAGVVISCILLYRYWQIIQDGKARTSPGKAVGFCFIPFFNFYWFFVAIVGLAKDMNTYCDERNIEGSRVSDGLAVAWFILSLCGIIPYVGIATAIAAIVVWIILYKQFSDAAARIIEMKKR